MRLLAALLPLALLSCSAQRTPTNDAELGSALLQMMLDAPDTKAYSRALTLHGPVQDTEIPAILAAGSHWRSSKRANAAHAILIVRGEKSEEGQLRFLADTKDVDAWAIIIGGFGVLDHHPDWAGKRLDMVAKALDSITPETLAAGIRAGAIAHAPGIDAVVDRGLDSKDVRIRAACLESLTPEMMAKYLPRLRHMLGELTDPSHGYATDDSRNLLVAALFTVADHEIRTQIRNYYESAPKEMRLEFATMFNLSTAPGLEDAMWEYWQTPDKRQGQEDYYYPIQENALSSMTWHIVQKKDLPLTPRWARACLVTVQDPKRRSYTLDEDCANLAYFASGKQHGREWLDDKAWTGRQLQAWLAAHPK